MGSRPQTPRPLLSSIADVERIRAVFPTEMVQLPQWVPYRMKWNAGAGKFDKIPMNPNTGYNAKSNRPDTWGSFDLAVKRALNRKLGGVGFVFCRDDAYVGIDLDKCIDESGEVQPWAQAIINALDSYTELSPSGKGYHIIGRGKLPPRGRRNGQVEMYDRGRFFTVTGLVSGSGVLRDIQEELDKLHRELFKKSRSTSGRSTGRRKVAGTPLTDAEVIDKASKAANGAKFKALWRGEWEGAYPSMSEADQALCHILGWWTNYDPTRINALFRQSSLFRPEKWDAAHYADGRTYGQVTIEKAVEGHSPNEGYNPGALVKKGNSRRKKKAPIKIGGHYLTEIGNAERLVEKHGADLHFCHEWGKWFIWDELRWS